MGNVQLKQNQLAKDVEFLLNRAVFIVGHITLIK